MKLMRGLGIALFLSFFSMSPVFANPSVNLWEIAKPAPFKVGDPSDIFSFATPSATGVCIGLNFPVYQATGCTTQKGTTTVKACLDNLHQGRTYYISPSELYSLVNVAYSTAPTNIHCVKQQDYTNTGNNVTSGALTCTGGSTNTCTWSSGGSTATLTLNAGLSCATVADC
ncbi:MAG: hypothetical protein EBX40_01335 [Gammaproteobacteria bacterium]|nr:hypothetical protein [Gammaproteobacteria bacterium]